jgi:hypothetical protein
MLTLKEGNMTKAEGVKSSIRRIILAAAALALASCASTEVMEYYAAPGQEVLIGKGGAMRKVNDIDIWLQGGTPPRAFRILAQATTNYRTGTAGDIGQRQAALEQLASEAKKRGADAVIVSDEASQVAGYAGIPGVSTTTATVSGSTARATTTTSPGFAGALRTHQVGAAFVKYERQ